MPLLGNWLLEAMLIVLGPLLLLAFGLAPRGWANRHAERVAGLAEGATIVALVCALVSALLSALHLASVGRTEQVFTHAFIALGQLQIGIYYDALSAVLFVLVAFLGAVVTRYARRYLHGDPQRGYFLKWLCITIGAVLTLLVSGNLALFAAAWIATSLGLHQLLTFYSHRPAALVAARKKFVISRLGDLCLLAALALTYRVFGTWEFRELFASAADMQISGHIPSLVTPICLLLVGAAMLKSAQFPFHSWLPDTMETPTPVSALMHAGIINSGGFLIVRLSHLVSLSPLALDLLMVVGAFTAVFASLVMMTQASIKRMLAFSTVAQMGFMLLQCGLGAYTVAVLHIVAHSLYKAHAFLSSGSVVAIFRSSWTPGERPAARPAVFAASLLIAVLLTVATALLFGVSPLSEPGTVLLDAVFLMSLTYLLWSLWGHSLTPRLVASGLLLAATVSAAYFALHLGFKAILASALPSTVVHHPEGHSALLVAMVALFGALLVLQSQLPQWTSRPWFRTLYVHARNGFYINTLANRAIQTLWPA